MGANFDWSPVFNSLSQIMQQKKYQNSVADLMGSPQFNPVQVTPQVSAANPANSASRQAAYDAPVQSYSGPLGSQLPFNTASSMFPLLNALGPENGMPLLLDLAKSSIPKRNDPYTLSENQTRYDANNKQIARGPTPIRAHTLSESERISNGLQPGVYQQAPNGVISEIKDEKPIVSGGMASPDNGKTWNAIPGYVDQQSAIATAKRAPPKASAIPQLVHPSSMY